MSPAPLHSGLGLGSDMTRRHPPEAGQLLETSDVGGSWVELRQIRVVRARLGDNVRLSAPVLGVTVEAATFDEAWARFVNEVRQHPDSARFTFDVCPTRPEEIAKGLDAPEDEEWCEPADR